MISQEALNQIEHIKKRCSIIKPLVVIRCITYNHEAYLKETLEGFVIQKTDFPFIAVVHDDASTDGTAEILKEYAEKYPDKIFTIFEKENQWSKKDGSLGKIINTAVDVTGAKYIAFCEGDDYWTDPYKLQKQVQFLEQHPDYSLVHSNFEVIDKDGNIIEDPQCDRYKQKSKSGHFLYKLLTGNYILTCTVVARKNILFNSFYINSPYKLDSTLFLSAAREGKAYYFDEKMSCYRRNPNGQMLSNFDRVKFLSEGIMKYAFNEYLNETFPKCSSYEKFRINLLLLTRYYLKKENPYDIFNRKISLKAYKSLGYLNALRIKIRNKLKSL